MADERIFTVKINGLSQSYKDVSTLNDALNKLEISTQKPFNVKIDGVDRAYLDISDLMKAIKEMGDSKKKVFSISIDGIDKSFDDVKKLVEALEKLNSININIAQTVEKAEKAMRSQTIEVTEEDKALINLGRTLDRVQALESDVAREQLSATQQLRERTRELRLEVQAENAATNSVESMRIQLAMLKEEWKKLDVDSDQFEELSRVIDDLNSQILAHEKSIGVHQRNVGNYEESIKSALGLNSEFANSILDFSRNAETGESSVSSFFSNAGTSVKAFGKTLLGLLANPVFLAIAGIAGAGLVFKFWYDYNSGLVEATKLTKDFTGLAGDELKAFRNEVQGVSDTFGKDFKETLEASNAVAKQFGISQQEALSYIKDGFIAGADANGEYLDTLKEYPAFFKEAGISASEFIAITSETAKEGVFSDKGIDAIKEGAIRIRELSASTASALDGIGISSKKVQQDLQNGTKTTFDVIKEVSAKLNELPAQSQQVGTAIADIFGGAGEDAGLQYLQTLKDIETDLTKVKGEAGELGAIQEKQMNANIELQNVLSGLFDQTGGTFETMIGNAKVFATEALTSVIKGIVDVINYFIKLYNDSIAFRAIIIGLKYYYIELFTVIKSLFNYVIETGKIIGDVLYSAFTLDIDGVIDGYGRWAKNTIDIVKGVADETVKNFQNAKDEILDGEPIAPIEIPVNVVTDSKGVDVPKTPKVDIKPTGDKGGKENKELEEKLKTQLELKRKYEDLETELIVSEYEKKEAKIKQSYARQIEDLKEKLKTDKKLTPESIKYINDTVLLLERKQTEELDAIAKERSQKILGNQKEMLDIQQDDINNFYSDVQRKIEKSKVSDNGIIDVQATKKNLENIATNLNEYISKLEASKAKTANYYDNLASMYDEDSIEYKKIQHEKAQALRGFDNQIMDANDQLTDNTKKNTDVQSQYWQELGSKIQEYTDNIMNGVNAIFDAANSLLQAQLDEANEKYDAISQKYDETVEKREESNSRIQELEEQAKTARGGRSIILQQQISQEMEVNKQLADQEKTLAKDKEKQEKEIAKKEKQQKRMGILQGIAQGIASTSLGIIEAIAASPLTLGMPWSAIIAATGALQVGVMASQLTKLEDGGLLNGKRHANGGMRVEGTNIEVEGGEYVVNRESTNKNLGLIRYINNQRKELTPTDINSFFSKSSQGFEPPFKKMFETGGQLPTVTSSVKTDNDIIADAIREVKITPVVSVVDINNAQSDVVRIDDLAGL